MRARFKTFFSSGPLGAVVGAFSAPVFALMKHALVGSLAGALGVEPGALAGVILPMGVFPVFFGGAMIFGYAGGLFGGLYRRRRLGIFLGGLLGGLAANVLFTIQ